MHLGLVDLICGTTTVLICITLIQCHVAHDDSTKSGIAAEEKKMRFHGKSERNDIAVLVILCREKEGA